MNTSSRKRLQQYYRENPLMVSSPFGGVENFNRELLLNLLDRFQVSLQGAHVLDVGCGRGFAETVVREQGGRYTGTDMVVSRGDFRPVLADAIHLPFLSACFDGLFCIDAFEHFPEPLCATAEFYRVLRPGGFVFLSVPNYANVAGIVKKWCETVGSYKKDTWAPFRHWQPQELEQCLTPSRVKDAFRGVGFQLSGRAGLDTEVWLGLLPWLAHARAPERLLFATQRLFAIIGPLIVRIAPTASLHNFWLFRKPKPGRFGSA